MRDPLRRTLKSDAAVLYEEICRKLQVEDVCVVATF